MPLPSSAFAHIGRIASQRAVHAALGWLHLHEQQIARWQVECAAVPAPPFAEEERAAWIRARFEELGLHEVETDAAGNVCAFSGGNDAGPVVVLSAHLDTVFAAGTPLAPRWEGTRLLGPGVCDNGAGLAGLLAIAAALRHAELNPTHRVVFLANVGEEGEGNLRGMRQVYKHAPWRGRIAAHLVLDGAGAGVAVTGALGSRRFAVELTGAGGHSWTDAGRPNPLAALAATVTRMGPFLRTDGARTSWNLGSMEGGGAINAIPASAVARFDLRSTDAGALAALEEELRGAVATAVEAANRGVTSDAALRVEIRGIGDRPAGSLPEDARLLALLRAVDRHLQLRTEPRTASTDANIPLALGIPALALGAGGEGGGIHTLGEWFEAKGRDLGLRRILLLLLALAEDASEEKDADDL